MYEATATPRQRWKAQASAHRRYLREVQSHLNSASSFQAVERKLQQIRYVASPRGYGMPLPALHGFGLDRFRVGMSLHIWARTHAYRLGIRFDNASFDRSRNGQFDAYVARLRDALIRHLAKRGYTMPRQLVRAA